MRPYLERIFKMKILIIEDEEYALEVVKAYLDHEGYETYTAQDGARALKLFFDIMPDFVVLDLMLPDMTGEEICQEIRKVSETPILMLTAKSALDDRINGLEIGADDYLVKPFSPRELVTRIKTIMKRVSKHTSKTDYLYQDAYLIIDEKNHTVLSDNLSVSLTPNEFKLLAFLVRNKMQVFTREQLIEHILGVDYEGFDRTIDVHIKNLRKKIEPDPKNTIYIKTVFGIGYKFEGESNEKTT